MRSYEVGARVRATDYTFLPISGFTGANLKDALAPGFAPWYSYVHMFLLLHLRLHHAYQRS